MSTPGRSLAGIIDRIWRTPFEQIRHRSALDAVSLPARQRLLSHVTYCEGKHESDLFSVYLPYSQAAPCHSTFVFLAERLSAKRSSLNRQRCRPSFNFCADTQLAQAVTHGTWYVLKCLSAEAFLATGLFRRLCLSELQPSWAPLLRGSL